MFKQKINKRTIEEINNYKNHFLIFALFVTFVSILTFYKTKSMFDNIFMATVLIFDFLALFGVLFKNDRCINFSDYAFNILMVIGIIFAQSSEILLFLVFINIITLLTRYLYNGCLFKLATKKYHRLLPKYITGDFLHGMMIIIIFIKMYVLNLKL